MIGKALIGSIATRRSTGGGGGTTTPLSFTIIPSTGADFTYTPGRAAEQWHGGNEVNIPVEGTNTPRTDYYRRWQWILFEDVTQGVYDWTEFDDAVHEAITANQKFSFGISTLCEGCDDRILVNGAFLSYPRYLHTLMQGETTKDWKSNGTGPNASGDLWVPNWNSEFYLSRYEALMNAIANRIATQSFTPPGGVSTPFSKVIQYIDIRGYGQYGEWHHVNIVSNTSAYPAGTQATATTLLRIVDAHKTAFPNFPLVTMIAAFDGGTASGLNILYNPPEVGAYTLSTTNSWGKFGWRKDSYGDTASYLPQLLENNNVLFGGVDFDVEIMNRYKFSPVVGEPVFGGNYSTQLPADVNKYHSHSFGNGNYGVTLTTAVKNGARAASKACGYRMVLTGGTGPLSIPQSTNFGITLNWQNVGLSPTYEDWNVQFELRNGSTVVWSGTSTKTLRGFLATGSATPNVDTFNFGTSVAPGTYNLYLIIRESAGYRLQAFPLAINGRNADGSYTLVTGVTVTT